ncbi:MAG: hypothetical protein QGG36_10140 [Pirellulaceae bacterium]|nr:hypothetical protein [Pirellulaceae bacterium]MDP7016150.1 hypothetical protein [Pirellulaceae bacterium]
MHLGRHRAPQRAAAHLTVNMLAVSCLVLIAATQSEGQTRDGRTRDDDADGERVVWKTGSSFRQQLSAESGVRFGSSPVRGALTKLARQSRIAIFVDRRVPTDRRIDLSMTDSLETVIEAMADEAGMGTALLGSIVYVGPRETASRIEALVAVQRGVVSANSKNAWLRRSSLQWDRLSEPRRILAQLAKEGGASIENPERVPHDLWPAVELPSATLIDRLTLVLAGFDLTFRFRPNNELELIQVPREAQVRLDYSNSAGAEQRIKKAFPEVEVKRNGRQLSIATDLATHQRIDRMLANRSSPQRAKDTGNRPTKDGERTVYTLTLTNKPVGGVVKSLAQQLELELEIADSAADRLATKISLKVRKATLDELLKAALGQAKLRHKIDGKTLRIEAAD